MKKNKSLFIILIFLAIFIVQPNNFNAIKSGLTQNDIPTQLNIADSAEEKNSDSNLNPTLKNDDLKSKEYDGKNQVIVVNEKSQFTKSELSLENGSWEKYSDLDFLNRVGIAEAMLGKELMPTEDRESISSITPTGWKNKKIIFNGKEDYLYNRSHLIGFQLSGENANYSNKEYMEQYALKRENIKKISNNGGQWSTMKIKLLTTKKIRITMFAIE